MANISGDWNKSMPSGSSSISDGDDLQRQHWTSLESTLATDHRFGSSETLAGYHKPGTARVYTGLSSALSATFLQMLKRAEYLQSWIQVSSTCSEHLHKPASAQELVPLMSRTPCSLWCLETTKQHSMHSMQM